MSAPKHLNQAQSNRYVVPHQWADLIGPPPTLFYEDRDRYQRLFDLVAEEKAPQTLLDWIDVKELVDGIWKRRQLNEFQRALIDNMRDEGLVELLAKTEKNGMTAMAAEMCHADLARAWMQDDPDAIATAEGLLAKIGAGYAAVTAEALASRIDLLSKIDRLIHNATLRMERSETHLAARDALRRAREADELSDLIEPELRRSLAGWGD